NDPAPAHSYTLSLHDALPISGTSVATNAILLNFIRLVPSGASGNIASQRPERLARYRLECSRTQNIDPGPAWPRAGETHMSETRSEEHTSELQSRENLVCRLL